MVCKGLIQCVQPRRAAGDARTTRSDDIDRRLRSSIYQTAPSLPTTDRRQPYVRLYASSS